MVTKVMGLFIIGILTLTMGTKGDIVFGKKGKKQ